MRFSVKAPKITSGSSTFFTQATADVFQAEAKLERINIGELDVSNVHAANLSVDEAILVRTLFIEAHLEKLSFVDVEFGACDFSAAHCSESSFIRVHGKGGRISGADFSQSTLRDVVFEDCKFELANFRFAKLANVRFIRCQLKETDFQAAELQNVAFEQCLLEKTAFSQCKIKNVDVRSSQLYDIRGWQSLKGLKIDQAQLISVAPELALELGLVVATE